MELRQLKTFHAVARLSSFHRAAEALHYAQSTVSVQIRLLEEEFGVPLFDRLGKQVRLTESGRMLQRYAARMLAMEKETLSQVAGCHQTHGMITVRIPQSLATHCLPDALKLFRERFPQIGFDIGTCAWDALPGELKGGVTDVAFLLAESIPFAELEAELMGTVRLVLAASPAHPLAARTGVAIADLAGQAILLPKHDCAYRMVLQQMLDEEKVVPQAVLELNSIAAIVQCAVRGVGICLLPRAAVDHEIGRGALCILPWAAEDLETGVLMIRHKNKWVSPPVAAFMEISRSVFTRWLSDGFQDPS